MDRKAFRLRHRENAFLTEDVLLERTRTPFVDSQLIYLCAYGESHARGGCQQELTHSYWGISIVMAGSAVFQAESGKYTVTPGTICIVRPYKIYHYIVPENTFCTRRYLIINHGLMMSLIGNQGLLAGSDVVYLSEPERISAIYDKIKTLATEGGDHLLQRLSVEAYSFFAELIRQLPRRSAREDFELQVRRLADRLGERHTLESLARDFNVGERTLARMFQRELGVTPIEFLIRMRLEYAASLLVANTLPIRAIAEECGYRDAVFFTRAFKKRYGETPHTYREQGRKSLNRHIQTDS